MAATAFLLLEAEQGDKDSFVNIYKIVIIMSRDLDRKDKLSSCLYIKFSATGYSVLIRITFYTIRFTKGCWQWGRSLSPKNSPPEETRQTGESILPLAGTSVRWPQVRKLRTGFLSCISCLMFCLRL